MMKFGRRTALSLTAGLLLACSIVTLSPARAASAQEAGGFIQSLADRVISLVASRQSAPEEVRQFGALFGPSIDVPSVGQFILGRYWRQATPAQQQEFLRLFEEFNVLVWSKRFNDYNGEKLRVTSTQADGDRFIVDSEIARPGGKPIIVQWAVRSVGGGYKIVDITVEGVSMAISNRSDYASAIQSQGGIDGLLNSMRQRIASMKAERGIR